MRKPDRKRDRIGRLRCHGRTVPRINAIRATRRERIVHRIGPAKVEVAEGVWLRPAVNLRKSRCKRWLCSDEILIEVLEIYGFYNHPRGERHGLLNDPKIEPWVNRRGILAVLETFDEILPTVLKRNQGSALVFSSSCDISIGPVKQMAVKLSRTEKKPDGPQTQ